MYLAKTNFNRFSYNNKYIFFYIYIYIYIYICAYVHFVMLYCLRSILKYYILLCLTIIAYYKAEIFILHLFKKNILNKQKHYICLQTPLTFSDGVELTPHSRIWQSLVSLASRHSGLLLVTRLDTPIPQVAEHGDQSVTCSKQVGWTMGWDLEDEIHSNKK